MNKAVVKNKISKIYKKVLGILITITMLLVSIFPASNANTKAFALPYKWGFKDNYMFLATNFWNFEIPIFKSSGEFSGKYFSKDRKYPVMKVEGERAYITNEKDFYIPTIFVTPTIHSKPARVFSIVNDKVKVYKFKKKCKNKENISNEKDIEIAGWLDIFSKVTVRGASGKFISTDFNGDASEPYFVAAKDLEYKGKFQEDVGIQKESRVGKFEAINDWNFDLQIYRDTTYFNENNVYVETSEPVNCIYGRGRKYCVFSIKGNKAYVNKEENFYIPMELVTPLMMNKNMGRLAVNKNCIDIYEFKNKEPMRQCLCSEEDLIKIESVKNVKEIFVRGYVRSDFGNFVATDYKGDKSRVVLINAKDFKEKDLPNKWLPEDEILKKEVPEEIVNAYNKNSPDFIFKDYREKRGKFFEELYEEFKEEFFKIFSEGEQTRKEQLEEERSGDRFLNDESLTNVESDGSGHEEKNKPNCNGNLDETTGHAEAENPDDQCFCKDSPKEEYLKNEDTCSHKENRKDDRTKKTVKQNEKGGPIKQTPVATKHNEQSEKILKQKGSSATGSDDRSLKIVEQDEKEKVVKQEPNEQTEKIVKQDEKSEIIKQNLPTTKDDEQTEIIKQDEENGIIEQKSAAIEENEQTEEIVKQDEKTGVIEREPSATKDDNQIVKTAEQNKKRGAIEQKPVTVEDLVNFDNSNTYYAPYLVKILHDTKDPNFSPSEIADSKEKNIDVIAAKLSKICHTIYFSQEIESAKGVKILPNVVQVLAVLKFAHKVLCGESKGVIGEIKTGEGKSFIITIVAILLAQFDRKIDVVTTNMELAYRDQKEQEIFYDLFNVKSGLLFDKEQDKGFIGKEDAKKACLFSNCNECQLSLNALKNHVVYSTNCNFEWLYLRLLFAKNDSRMRDYDVVIIDEVDNILLDQAMSPALLSIPFNTKNSEAIFRRVYEMICSERRTEEISKTLRAEFSEADFTDETVGLLIKAAICASEKKLGRDYIFKNGELQIIDLNTGFIKHNSRWSAFVHEMIEIKEGIKVKSSSATECGINQLSFFKFYNNIIGLTGTVGEEKDQNIFKKYYDADVFHFPSNLPSKKKINYKDVENTKDAIFKEISNEAKEESSKGRPVLLIFDSVAASDEFKNEYFPESRLIRGIEPPEDREAVRHAGEQGSVTVATNAAGRGTDIKLKEAIKENGGLHVIISNLPPRKRTLMQNIGRTARQGSPGSASVYINSNESFYEIEGFGDIGENLFSIQTDFSKYLRQNWPWLFEYRRELGCSDTGGLVFPFGVKSEQVLKTFANVIADRFLYQLFVPSADGGTRVTGVLNISQIAQLSNLLLDMVLTAWGNVFSYMSSQEKFKDMNLCSREYQNFIQNLLEWLPENMKNAEDEGEYLIQKTGKCAELKNLMRKENKIIDIVDTLLRDRRFIDYVVSCGCDPNDFSQTVKCLPQSLQLAYAAHIKEVEQQRLDEQEKSKTRAKMKELAWNGRSDDELVTIEVSIFDPVMYTNVMYLMQKGEAYKVSTNSSTLFGMLVRLKRKTLVRMLELTGTTREDRNEKSVSISGKSLIDPHNQQQRDRAKRMLRGVKSCFQKSFFKKLGFEVVTKGNYVVIKGARCNDAINEKILGTRYAFKNAYKNPQVFKYAKKYPIKQIGNVARATASPIKNPFKYLDVALNTLEGVEDNINLHAEPSKIVTDAVIDAGFGVSGIYVSSIVTAAICSSFPPLVIASPAIALSVQAITSYALENQKIYGKSIKDHVKGRANEGVNMLLSKK
ncbi:MAG: hypothetical protein LBH37_03070 [Oscillospiraceae bacterium]|jgi:hypothetical protein|nr:hypothetical protein [Oscillospiraceae bacterium]